jgi:uncharacterized protein YcbK (DUF882 family)
MGKQEVVQAQEFATAIGIQGLKVNGVNGFYTRRFVRTFQSAFQLNSYGSHPLKADGIPGPLTIQAMQICEENGYRLSSNFKITEFMTKGSRKVSFSNEVVKVDRLLVASLQRLRENLGFPIVILSAYRDPRHNKRVGGAKRSQHLFGKAVDLNRPRIIRNITEAEARNAGFNAVGMLSRSNPDVIHMDVRDSVVRWYYS